MTRAWWVAAMWAAATMTATPTRGSDPAAAAVRHQDSVQQHYQQTFRELRDSVSVLRARLSTFRRFTDAGDETVLEWAARLHRACDHVAAALRAAEPVLRGSGNGPHGPAARSFLETVTRTRSELIEHCVRGLAPAAGGDRVDSLRTWAPYRVGKIELALVGYEREAGRFARAVGIKLEG